MTTLNHRPNYTKHPFIATSHSGTGTAYVSAAALPIATSALFVTGTGALQVAPLGGWRLTEFHVVNEEAASRTGKVYIGSASGTCRLLCNFPIAASAGYIDALPVSNILNSTTIPGLMKDNAGNYYMDIPQGLTLFVTTITANKVRAFATLYDYIA